MNTLFSSLVTRTWKLISAHPKMSGIVFLYQFIPSLVFFALALCAIVCTTFIMPRMGIDISNPAALQGLVVRFVNSPIVLITTIVVGLVCIFGFLLFQLTCSYLARLGLAHMSQKKKFNFSYLLREWRGMWSWAGTGLVTAVYFISVFVLTALIAVGCVYFYELLAVVPVVLGGATLVFLGIALAFTFPVYFFENKRYFAATERSRQMVKGRWWKTFGNFLLLGLAITLVSLALFALENGTQYSSRLIPDSFFDYKIISILFALGTFLFMVFQSAVNIMIQLFALLYTFELYHEYDKTPVRSKK